MNKTEIKNSAIKIFAAKGYHDTTMNEIAESIGITKPALYYHFKSKKDLYFEIVDDQKSIYALALQKTYDELKDKPLESILETVFLLFIKASFNDDYLLSKRTIYMATFDSDDCLKTFARNSIKIRDDLWLEKIKSIMQKKNAYMDKNKLDAFLISAYVLLKGFTDWIIFNEEMTESEILTLAHNIWSNFWHGNKPDI